MLPEPEIAPPAPDVNILPPVMLPVALIKPTVVTFPPAILPVTFNALITLPLKLMLVVFTLPLVKLPVALTIPPVRTLPAVALPVALIKPPVRTFPPMTLPVELTVVADNNPLPLNIKLLPVALPMFGVVKFAPALTIMLPPPLNAVVSLSTNALNTVPVKLIPAAVLAV